MTDTTIAPVVAPEATTSPPAPEPAPAPAAPAVEHTPGGWPVVPLAVTGTNTGTSLVAAAALVGGGPAALAVAATGATVLGAVAVARKRREKNRLRKTPTHRTSRSATGLGSSGRASRHSGSGRVPSQVRSGNTGIGKNAGRGRDKSARKSTGSAWGTRVSNRRKPSMAPARPSLTKPVPPKTGTGAGAGKSSAGKSGGRVGQVRALRDAARTASPSRAARRSETSGARRSVADARRSAKDAARTASAGGKGVLGRSVGKAAGRINAAKSAAVQRSRRARDQRTADTVAAQRDAVRKAPLRKAARKALRRSAARFQGRRLLAAVLGGALGLVGLVTTPLGRKLGWAWLMYPGRRLYARLTLSAQERRAARDAAIQAELEEQEAALDEAAEEISDKAERPVGPTPAAPTTVTVSEGVSMSGFRFEEHAAEMEAAAQQYDPEGAMEILAMVEGLPIALTSIANVMQILGERSDAEFPLEKSVAESFRDCFGAVMAAVAVAEEMGTVFRISHVQDIARHEDPRNGTEAEKGWNV